METRRGGSGDKRTSLQSRLVLVICNYHRLSGTNLSGGGSFATDSGAGNGSTGIESICTSWADLAPKARPFSEVGRPLTPVEAASGLIVDTVAELPATCCFCFLGLNFASAAPESSRSLFPRMLPQQDLNSDRVIRHLCKRCTRNPATW